MAAIDDATVALQPLLLTVPPYFGCGHVSPDVSTRGAACIKALFLLCILPGAGNPPLGCGVAIIDDATVAHLLLKGVLDPAQEVAKLQKKVRALFVFVGWLACLLA